MFKLTNETLLPNYVPQIHNFNILLMMLSYYGNFKSNFKKP